MDPHELFVAAVEDALGRRTVLFGQMSDDFLAPLVRGVADELSIYLQMRPAAKLSASRARLLEGHSRTYVLTDVQDRKAPLRLNAEFDRWNIRLETSGPKGLVDSVNARRWYFANREMHRFLLPLLTDMSDVLVEYYLRRPYAVPKCGIIRWLEGIDATTLCVEVDDRSQPSKGDWADRYRVQ